jgi:hypothetical protein
MSTLAKHGRSAALIEPDHNEHSPKRQRLSLEPDSVVSALLLLSKSTECDDQSKLWPDLPSSLIILEAREETDYDGNHVSDDEDELSSPLSTRTPLLKPILPSCSIVCSVPCYMVQQRDYKSATKEHTMSPLILPVGRPLAAAPGLPCKAIGAKIAPLSCSLIWWSFDWNWAGSRWVQHQRILVLAVL